MYDIDNSFLKGVWYVGGESIAGANNDLKIVDGVINGTESNISKGSRSVVNLKKKKNGVMPVGLRFQEKTMKIKVQM
jgi:hypothetical protein